MDVELLGEPVAVCRDRQYSVRGVTVTLGDAPSSIGCIVGVWSLLRGVGGVCHVIDNWDYDARIGLREGVHFDRYL